MTKQFSSFNVYPQKQTGTILASRMTQSWHDLRIEKTDNIYKQSFPVIEFRKNSKVRKPWINGALLNSIKKGDRRFALFIKTRILYYFNQYKKFRNKLEHNIKTARHTYYDNKFAGITNNAKKMWQTATSCRGCRRKSSKSEVLKT